ncbi:MAG TPA: MG2 domain-containing protein, partial [Abditibacterium sp.]
MNASLSFPPSIFNFLPRHGAALLTLLGVGGALAFSVSQETAVGRVEGRALLGEDQKPLPRVKVTLVANQGPYASETATSEVRRFRAETDAQGRFQVARLPVGFYRLSAASKAHSTDETSVFVSEDEVSEVPLRLKRSQPDLQVTPQQTEWLSSEEVTLPVHGYVDGAAVSLASTSPAASGALRVRIFRTQLSQMLRDADAARALGTVGNRYTPISMLPAAILHPKIAQSPQLVATRSIPIAGADIEGWFHQRLKLGALRPGLYLVDVKHGAHSVCAQMRVSDTALVVKKSRDTLLAWTVDSQSGAPRPNAAIQVFQGGKALASARSDAQGLARIALKRGSEAEGRLMTLASLGGSEAVVGQYDGGSDESRGQFTVHAYTDRPIYRPGGVVSFKGIARRTLDAGLRYAVPTGENVAVEVRDPSGGRVMRTALKTNRFGSFHGTATLSPEAPTGLYSIVMSLGGEEHTADFAVASYRKPEFSATLTPNEKHYAFGDRVEMMLGATYYFGAPVSGAKAHYTVFRAPDWASQPQDEADFEATEDELGDEAAYADESGEVVEEGNVTLDGNGQAIIGFAAQKQGEKASDEESESMDEPQDQIYSVQVTVTDAANRAVDASGQVPVTAGDFRLSARTAGYFSAPGELTAITVSAQDFEGKPVAGAPIRLVSSYETSGNNSAKASPAQNLSATTGADGRAVIRVTPPREGVLTLRAETSDAKKRAIVATQTLWVAGDEGGDYDASYSELSLLTDKKRYQAGETARVLLNSESGSGTALVSIEGSKLFRSFLVPLEHRSTAVRVPISGDYGPNITLSACLVRDKKLARSEAPLRVEVPQRQIRVAVQSDRAKYQPGDRVSYRVQTSDFQGKPVPAEISFGVVDEAIYALQEDDKTALRSAFYPRNPNSVETSYSFEPLYLGDANKAAPVIEARRKFLDTAFWQSDLQTDERGQANVSFRLPDNLTTWRATAVAQTLDTAFGRRTQQVVVAKDFFVRLETPRFLTGGDATQISALVHNDSATAQTATVKLEADGLKLGGEATQSVEIGAGAIGRVVWPVETDAAGQNFAGLAHFKLSAWTPKSANGIQLTDAVETDVPVRARGRERIENFVGHLEPGAQVSHQLPIDAAAIAGASRVTVRITPSVSDSLVGALKYLVGFPYGCTEQTMSRFLPDILVQRTLRLRGEGDAEAVQLKKRLPAMVRDGLTRLSRFQHPSGGWGWWEA